MRLGIKIGPFIVMSGDGKRGPGEKSGAGKAILIVLARRTAGVRAPGIGYEFRC